MRSPTKWNRPALSARATAGEAFVASIRAATEQVRANAAGAAAGRDPEYLHQLRVGVRRLRSALRAFRELLRRKRADAIEAPWRAMMQTLGAARDWDVFQHSLEPGELRAEAGRQRREAQRQARALVRSPGFAAAARRTFVWAQRHPWRRRADPAQPLAGFARGALEHLHESLRRSARGIEWRDAARRHRVRIRVKRMRYGCDFFASAFPQRHARNFLESLRTLQDILGEMNDIEVQRGLLRKLVPSGSAIGLLEMEGAVRERLASRERALIAALGPAWEAFESRRRFWRSTEAGRARG
jgi:CHAD domain-containing protein